MRREKLTELVERAAVAEGYAFSTGEEQNINGAVRVWPAAWLVPPVVREKTGRREGEISYRITLHLMALSPAPESSGSVGTEAVWGTLEKSALRIGTALASAPEVCSVSGVSCNPGRQSLTAHGEVSVTLVCDIKMWYYI